MIQFDTLNLKNASQFAGHFFCQKGPFSFENLLKEFLSKSLINKYFREQQDIR